MNWSDFENELLEKHIYTINNNSPCDIVLFGSCHMATIGFMLNKLLNFQYNIHIILSWFFEDKGLEKFNMQIINDKIQHIVSKCVVFLYHEHINDYGVNATKLTSLTNSMCYKMSVPNYRLDYNSGNYAHSLHMLEYFITNSSFPEFKFVIDNHKNIMFFSTTNHPTHYLLFLQSQSIANKILKNGQTITISNYFDINNRNYYKHFDYVVLPGKIEITNEISQLTGIQINAEYFS